LARAFFLRCRSFLQRFNGLEPRPIGQTVSVEFEELVQKAIDSLPPDLASFMENVAVVVEDEPPPGLPLLGLYQGVPLTRRTSSYAAVPPDKITIYQGPLERQAAGDTDRLRALARHVVVHEIAHHFGISDERLVELGAY